MVLCFAIKDGDFELDAKHLAAAEQVIQRGVRNVPHCRFKSWTTCVYTCTVNEPNVRSPFQCSSKKRISCASHKRQHSVIPHVMAATKHRHQEKKQDDATQPLRMVICVSLFKEMRARVEKISQAKNGTGHGEGQSRVISSPRRPPSPSSNGTPRARSSNRLSNRASVRLAQQMETLCSQPQVIQRFHAMQNQNTQTSSTVIPGGYR